MTDNSGHLWHGRFSGGPADELMAFTASLAFDRHLWHDDITGSRAHVNGLERAGLLAADEAEAVRRALDVVHGEFAAGSFDFVDSDEDIHTAIERRVTEIAGDAGAKLHTSRSRFNSNYYDIIIDTCADWLDGCRSEMFEWLSENDPDYID